MTPDAALALRPTLADGALAVASDGHLVSQSPDERVAADGYLRLTAHVLLASERRGFRSIGVLSPTEPPGESRTAAAVNLAACLGRTRGRRGRVLLVDGDARRRALSRMFCGADERGGEGRHPLLVGTSLEGVDVMTAPEGGDVLSLHAPEAWVAAFEELGRDYRHIVIDCPPVLDDPAGLVLRECVDEIVLVLRAGETSKRAVRRAVGQVGGRVLGVILQGAVGSDADAA
jgi:Mrp family chromosome partitioning ATPase